MKQFKGKTIEEALSDAGAYFGCEPSSIYYKVVEEKKGLFKKEATIEVYEEEDAVAFACEYLKNAIGVMGIEVETETEVEDGVIRITMNSNRNPVLIGRSGRTLRALNELVRLAVSNRFHKRYRILLDAGGYKQEKYGRIAYLAKRTAKDVLRSHVDAELEPMPADERRIVHNTLSGMEHIKTESSGEGEQRAVTIKYVD